MKLRLKFFAWGTMIGVAAGTAAATLEEQFESDPFARGWFIAGDTNLFTWNQAAQRMEIIWDSSRTNSFLMLPLHTVLATNDDFQIQFEVWLDNIQAGANPDKPSTFPLGLGLTRMASALRTNFFRGLGTMAGGPVNMVEFAHFPAAPPIQPTISPVCVSSNGLWQPNQYTSLYALATGVTYNVTMTHSAAEARLVTTMTENGTPFPAPPAAIQTANLATHFADFRLDAFYVASYSDAVQTGPAMFHGSIYARGWVDNVRLTFPSPPILALEGALTAAGFGAGFESRNGWSYRLERSEDNIAWHGLGPFMPGTGAAMILMDSDPPATQAFYRVAADRP